MENDFARMLQDATQRGFFAPLEMKSDMVAILASAIQAMRDRGATSEDIARMLRHAADVLTGKEK